jgi:DNA end-binding protein Ku
LREGLIRRKVAAIGKVCMRQTENIVFILPHPDGGLVAYTAYLADEIRQIKFGTPAPVSDAEASAVCNFIDAMTEDLNMSQYQDEYRVRLAALIQAKQEGKALPEEAPKPKPVQSDNLLEMLTTSTAMAQAARAKKERKTA